MDNDKRNKLNKLTCLRLLRKLQKAGWIAFQADYESLNELTIAEKQDLIFQLDGADILCRKDKIVHYVTFNPYNVGIECIANWSFTKNDADGFCKLLDDFTYQL